jgi:predicted ATPase
LPHSPSLAWLPPARTDQAADPLESGELIMKRYILTGAPGSGKTSILACLRDQGYAVVAEAATDVIAAAQARGVSEPWDDPRFADHIVELQRARQQRPATAGVGQQIYDRSPVCTLALARYLGHPVTPALSGEIDRIRRERIYQRQVFFVRPLGFCAPTPARRISYADSLEFERYHEAEYRRLGFELVDIPAGPAAERAAAIDASIRAWARPSPGRAPSADLGPAEAPHRAI